MLDPSLYKLCQEFGHKLFVSPLSSFRYCLRALISILRSWTLFCCVTPLSALPTGFVHFRSSTSGLHNRELTSDLLFLLFQLSILEYLVFCQGYKGIGARTLVVIDPGIRIGLLGIDTRYQL